MRIFACFPTLPNLSSRKSKKKAFLKKTKLSDIRKTSCKSLSMKFLEVNNSWNYLQYFAKEVEQSFMKEFSCEQKRKIQFNLLHVLLEIHYFTVYARAKPKSDPAVVARLGLPDIVELMDLLILYNKRFFWVSASVLRSLSSNLSVRSSRSCYLWLLVLFLTCTFSWR